MTLRHLCFVAGLGFALAAIGVVHAQDANPADSVVWKKVHASVFADAPLEAADHVLTLDTPRRAEDAAIVPIAIRAQFPQTRDRYIERVWLIVDNNPSPIAAIFHFTLESGRADIETRIRIEEYTFVRAVALTNDGKAVHGRQLCQGVGRLLGACGQGCDRSEGQPREDARPRQRRCRGRASLRWRN